MKRFVVMFLSVAMLVMTLATNSFAYPYRTNRDYPVITNAWWENRTARWSTDGYADKYEVRLFRDYSAVTTITTYSTSCSFDVYISLSSSEYYFKVRPYNDYTGWGAWVSSDRTYYGSRSYSYEPSRAYNYGPPVYDRPYSNNNNSIVTYGTSRNVVVPTPQIVYDNGVVPLGAFVYPNGETYYTYANGVYARNTWLNTKGKWYYFDTTAKMVRGLYTLNGSTYYFNEDGSMAIGATVIDGVTHYFDALGIMVY